MRGKTQAKRSRPLSRGTLVSDTAERLRDLIFVAEPGELIGSLQNLASTLGVGIVTLQQAARVLEHEGLLTARTGPGGGFYGARPDRAALERSLAAYMRMYPASQEEALDMTSLLFTQLATAAASCRDETLRDGLRALAETLEACEGMSDIGNFESDFQDLLFRMVDRPLFELLTHVTLHFFTSQPGADFHVSGQSPEEWRAGRYRIIDAILRNDAELARFEADRSNRRGILDHLAKKERKQP
jgi:GntR family transcriptional repressor for pyruvate dehydrogenase complex